MWPKWPRLCHKEEVTGCKTDAYPKQFSLAGWIWSLKVTLCRLCCLHTAVHCTILTKAFQTAKLSNRNRAPYKRTCHLTTSDDSSAVSPTWSVSRCWKATKSFWKLEGHLWTTLKYEILMKTKTVPKNCRKFMSTLNTFWTFRTLTLQQVLRMNKVRELLVESVVRISWGMPPRDMATGWCHPCNVPRRHLVDVADE